MESKIYSLKKATTDDTETIVHFQIELARESENVDLDHGTVTKGVANIFKEPDLGFYLLALDAQSTAAGCMHVLKEWSDWRNTYIWWLHDIYVAPPHRGHGVFTQLFKHVESLARSAGTAGLRLYVETSNEIAKKAYAGQGMNNWHYEMFEKMF
ncbi:GNAT family N-acetyltransferase [Candidatus Latescibacterota bacterium]